VAVQSGRRPSSAEQSTYWKCWALETSAGEATYAAEHWGLLDQPASRVGANSRWLDVHVGRADDHAGVSRDALDEQWAWSSSPKAANEAAFAADSTGGAQDR
jgi:hypothetical protein